MYWNLFMKKLDYVLKHLEKLELDFVLDKLDID